MLDTKRSPAYVELIAATAKAAVAGEALRDALPRLCDALREAAGVSVALALGAHGSERAVYGDDALLEGGATAIPVAFSGVREGTLYVAAERQLAPADRDSIETWACILAMSLRQSQVEADNRRLEAMAQSDQVTGIANRRAFDAHLQRTWNEAAPTQAPVAVLVIDIDFFKAYNDRYGHLAGDAALRRVASAVAAFANRSGDLAARLGGEEFSVVLADADEDTAFENAERIRMRVEDLAIEHASSDLGVLSVSIGAAAMPATRDRSPSTLVNRADNLLYRAKREGRNRAISGQRHSNGRAIARQALPAQTIVPVPSTPLVGRAEDLRRCLDALDRSRLLTLTGARGSGKTRMAAALAEGSRSWNAVWYLDVSATGAEQIYAEFARTFDLIPHAAAPLRDQLLALVRERRGILIVDGADTHKDLSGFIDDLLRSARHLHVLAIAAAPLRIAGETSYELRGLDVDAPFKLFVQRRAVPAGMPKVETRTIHQCCEAARGTPQIIELIAATQEPRPAATVEEAIAASYEALTPQLRAAASALALLAPVYSAQTAADITGAGERDLEALCERNLLFRAGPQDRYAMPRAVAQHCLQDLDAQTRDAIERRRYERYVQLAADRNVAQLSAEVANLRAALAHAETSDDPERLAFLASKLQPFWLSGSHMLEGLYWLEEALRRAPHAHAAGEVLANTWRFAGILSRRRSDYLRASKYNELALQAWRSLANPAGIASALNGLALVAHNTGDFERARRLYEESLELAQAQGDGEATAMALQNLAGLAMYRFEYDEAERRFDEAATLARSSGDASLAALIDNNLAELRFMQERFDEARNHARESLHYRLQTGETTALAATWLNLANVEISLGNLGAAWRAARESLLLYRSVTDHRGVANAIVAIARLLCASERLEEAARMAASADAILARSGARLFGADLRARELVDVPAALRGTPAADFEQAFEEALTALNVR